MISSWPGLTADAETGMVYLASGAHVYAVDAATGTEKWRFPREANNKITFYAAPVLDEENRILAGGYDSTLYCLEPISGTQQWAFEEATDHYVAAPLVYDGLIYAPNADHNLYAIKPDGSLAWKFTAGNALWGTPVADGERLYLASMDHFVYALDAASGEQLWKSDELSGSTASTPTLGPDNLLYVGTFGSELAALDKETGRIAWRVPATGWVWAGPALDGDTLYYGDLNGSLFAVNAATGKSVWTAQLEAAAPRSISDRPVVMDGRLYFVSDSGTLFAVNAENNNPVWNKKLDKGMLYTTPLVVDGKILVAPVGANALLIAFDENSNQVWVFEPAK